MSYRQRLTDLGRDVIAKGQTGLVITFTRIQLGEGVITDPNTIEGMTTLISPVMNSPIVAVARTALAQATITTKIPLASIPRDFHLTEIGVFARVGTESEVLYGVSYSIGIPDVISQEMGGGSTAEHTISIAVLVGTTMDVTAIFDPDIEVVNIGNGAGLYANRVGNQFRFKRIQAAGGLQLTESPDTITLATGAIVPVGGMIPFAGPNIPNGWLLCDGRTVPISGYTNLFLALGDRYGGDGVTTFGLPDCRNRSLIGTSDTRSLGSVGGSETHQLTVAELAAHNHGITQQTHNHGGTLLDWGHSHGVIDAVHGHSSPAHNHIAYFSTNAGTGGPGPGDSFPAFGQAGNWNRDYSVTSGSMIIWEVLAFTSSTAIGINNSWSNISSTYGAFTGAQVQGGNANIQINNNGSSAPHNNMPPYLTINWIIRT